MRESVNGLGVRQSQGEILTFDQQARGRWLAEGESFYYWVVKNEGLWTTVVVARSDLELIDRNDVTSRHLAQEVAEEFESLEQVYVSAGRHDSGMTRMAVANRAVMMKQYPDDPKRWLRRIPSHTNLSFLRSQP